MNTYKFARHILDQKEMRRNLFETASLICLLGLAFFIPISTVFTNLFIMSAGLLYLAAGEAKRKINIILNNPIAMLLIMLFCFFTMGTLYGSASLSESIVMLSKYDKLLFAALLFPIFYEKKCGKYCLLTFVISMAVTLFFSYLDMLDIYHYSNKIGTVAVFKDRITTNFFMVIAAYILANECLHHKKYRWLFGSVLLLMIHSILFLSDGRSGYAIFFALLAVFFIHNFRWKGVFYGFFACVLFSTLAYTGSEQFHSRLNLLGHSAAQYEQGNAYTSIGLRYSYIKNSLGIMWENPVLGTGTGSVLVVNKEFVKEKKLQTSNPHNEYVNIGIQLGLAGFILFIAMIAMQWRATRTLPEERQYIARGVILAFAVGCLANSFLMDCSEGHWYVYFIALLFGELDYVAGVTSFARPSEEDVLHLARTDLS